MKQIGEEAVIQFDARIKVVELKMGAKLLTITGLAIMHTVYIHFCNNDNLYQLFQKFSITKLNNISEFIDYVYNIRILTDLPTEVFSNQRHIWKLIQKNSHKTRICFTQTYFQIDKI